MRKPDKKPPPARLPAVAHFFCFDFDPRRCTIAVFVVRKISVRSIQIYCLTGSEQMK